MADSCGERRTAVAVTLTNTTGTDTIQIWQWTTLLVLDDPVDWTGPLVYDYVLANKGRFGICGVAQGLPSGRYQPGLKDRLLALTAWPR